MIFKKILRHLGCLLVLLVVFSFMLPTLTLKQCTTTNTNFVKACENEFRGVWFSYVDWEKFHSGKTQEEWEAKLKEDIIPNLIKFKINNVIVHATAFADSFYPSSLYPVSSIINGNNKKSLTYDPFRIMLNLLNEKGIKVHAWLNPLRAMTDGEFKKISNKYQTKIWYNSENKHRFYIKDSLKRYWLNPANEKVRDFLKKVVEELLKKYENIEGIHIDDYFYPNGLPNKSSKKGTVLIDDVQYYNEIKPGISLADWRRKSVTAFVKDFYDVCVKHKKIFGISPQGNFNNNLNDMFFNQEEIVSKGYAHYLMPQIYYGFKNKTLPFKETCNEWNKLISKNKNIKLYIGLAAYKLGSKGDSFAGNKGKSEWLENSDILKRQVETVRNIKDCGGFCLFSYNSLFSNSEHLEKEKSNYLELFKNKK